MTEFFVKLLSMSLAASCLILVILLLRLLLKGAPKWIPLLLWALVALRLICPISMESRLSLLPRVVGDPRIIESWRNDYAGDVRILHEGHPDYDKAVEAGGEVYPAGEGQFYTVASEKGAPNTIGDRLFPVLTRIWLLGAAGMLLYAAVSALRLRRRVSQAVLLRDNIFRSERVDSPFVLGLLCPRILLPLHLEGDAMELVIAHEKSHIRWGDPWWKLLGFLLLALYWFNPLVWLAYALLCRDMELACDERVIRGLDAAQRADYSEALLACSVRPGRIVACPLSFGEISVRQRIQNVLHYKKPTLWILLLALLLCAGAAVCFLTSPVAERNHIRLTETPSANDQGLRYGVKLDAPSLGCKLIAEQWKDGVCIDASPVYGYDEDFDLNTPIPLFFQHSLAAIRIRFKYDFDVTGSDELYVDDELLNCYFTNIDDENGLHTTGAFVFGNEHTDHPESYYRESLEQYETLEGYWKTFSWRSHQSSMTNVPYYRWGLSQEEANAIVAGTYDYKGTRISRHSRIVDGNRIVSDSMAVAYTKFRTRDIVKTNKTTNSTNSETIVDETPGELTMSIKIEGPYYNENDGWLFIIPQQAVSGLKFNFTTKRMGLISTLVPPYTMTGADGPIDYSPGSDPLANAKAETNYYLPGYRYTYTLTISQTNIRLDISIDDWNEINATQDIVF